MNYINILINNLNINFEFISSINFLIKKIPNLFDNNINEIYNLLLNICLSNINEEIEDFNENEEEEEELIPQKNINFISLSILTLFNLLNFYPNFLNNNINIYFEIINLHKDSFSFDLTIIISKIIYKFFKILLKFNKIEEINLLINILLQIIKNCSDYDTASFSIKSLNKIIKLNSNFHQFKEIYQIIEFSFKGELFFQRNLLTYNNFYKNLNKLIINLFNFN